MMYQIVRCPNCGRTYSSGVYREKTGSPLAQCAFCRQHFLDKSVDEWELRGIFGKFFYILFGLANVAVSGFFLAMLVLFLIVLPELFFDNAFSAFMLDDGNKFIGLIVVCVIINLVRVIIRERKDIAASKIRMTDPRYRELLRAVNLMK